MVDTAITFRNMSQMLKILGEVYRISLLNHYAVLSSHVQLVMFLSFI